MPTLTAQDELQNIVELIMASQNIPESQKKTYIESLEKDGLTPQLMDELEHFFEQDRAAYETNIAYDEKLIHDLDQIMVEEAKKNDEPQAALLTSFEHFLQGNEKNLESKLQQVDQDIDQEEEKAVKEESKSAEAAIREKLLKPKSTSSQA